MNYSTPDWRAPSLANTEHMLGKLWRAQFHNTSNDVRWWLIDGAVMYADDAQVEHETKRLGVPFAQPFTVPLHYLDRRVLAVQKYLHRLVRRPNHRRLTDYEVAMLCAPPTSYPSRSTKTL